MFSRSMIYIYKDKENVFYLNVLPACSRLLGMYSLSLLYTLGKICAMGGRITAVVYDTGLRRFVVMHWMARSFWFV